MVSGQNRIQGFTLVEMAIVLVVIGLLVGMGVGLIGPLTNRAKTSETKENLSAISNSLHGFAVSNNRLPTQLELPTVMKTPNDAWGGAIQYVASNSLTASPPFICNYRSTLISLRICNDPTCTTSTTVNNIAYLLLSRGANGNNQTGISQSVTATTTINTYLPGMAIDNYAGDINQPTDEYDDILVWVTLDELRSKIGCQGAQLKIVNNELPPGSATASAYSVNVTADGGIPYAAPNLYLWCVQTATGLTPHANMTFAPAVFSANCATLAEGTWGAAGQLAITWPLAPAPPTGAYAFTIFVRDNNDNTGTNDNIASKAFVLTVNP